ncbi:hypothetical protein CHL67_09560 [Prosthecochloris sp. GSB1]|uniref:LOG family protein n=1 Tax=Prosthecochloris sp. GSB1 TaxID=281093 RepID=UPI000B8CBC70|nr:LOG family protein [Prosthecochloris sp. GSB1]ASQ91129.1 hypothetical protein CHL67_09560 [Prosthecochloris sp. GSB1]
MDPQYRVAIFGSARIREGDREYNDVFAIAKGLAESGFDVVTGGGPGLMRAANAGHRSAQSGKRSIGLNIRLPHEQTANLCLDIKHEFERFSQRLDTFMSLSDAVVVAPGGIGTLLELFYAWQLVQVEHICETPIILFGSLWGGLLDWLKTEVLSRNMIGEGDFGMIFHVNEPEKVVALVRSIHEDRILTGHACKNFEKYRIDFGALHEGGAGA